MKIIAFEIINFHRFKDFFLELKYPLGHLKEGQSLDKICLIGQSGTGKTTILELLPKYLFNYDTNVILKSKDLSYTTGILSITFGNKNEFSSDAYFEFKKRLQHIWTSVSEHAPNTAATSDEIREEWFEDSVTQLIYFPVGIKYAKERDDRTSLETRYIIDLSKEDVTSFWNFILQSIQKYQEEELYLRQELSKTVEQSPDDLNAIKKVLNTLEDWKNKTANPINELVTALNNILSYFRLRVKTELNIRNKEDIGLLKIEDYTGKEIPFDLWSTATKQIIFSTTVLHFLKPKNTIILFDEPELSLYPDLQRNIIEFYLSFTENCQFICATHSPIIASSFEPWEIVELKFTEEGHIYRELYYEGENHVDNYKYNPRYMRWDDILQRIFDMKDDGSPERQKKLDELATFNVKYKKLAKQKKEETPEAKDALEHIATLSKELSKWDNLYAEN